MHLPMYRIKCIDGYETQNLKKKGKMLELILQNGNCKEFILKYTYLWMDFECLIFHRLPDLLQGTRMVETSRQIKIYNMQHETK